MPTPTHNRARDEAGPARPEAGIALVELLVVMLMLGIVFTALVRPMLTSTQVAARDQARSTAVQEAQTGLYKMTREVRGTLWVYGATSTSIDVAVASSSGTQTCPPASAATSGKCIRVLYNCAIQPAASPYRQCVRAWSTNLAVQPSTAAGASVIPRVVNGTPAAPSSSNPVFKYTPSASASPSASAPSFVAVNLMIPSSAGETPGYTYNVVLDDGAYLPNVGSQ